MTAQSPFLLSFTPGLMAQDTLEALFVQPSRLPERLVELITESATSRSKHYTLLVGGQGCGKTHLVALVYHRVRSLESLQGRLLVAWLREDGWGASSFLDLLVQVIQELKSAYPELVPPEMLEHLYAVPPDEAERVAAAQLLEFLEGRTLLLLLEDLDAIFSGLGDEGQKKLRAYLQQNPSFTILATARELFSGVSLQTSPFYGFFRIQHMAPLEVEEAARLARNVACLRDDNTLVPFLETTAGRARLRAVYHLAGGNHRVHFVFARLLTRDSLDELVPPVLQTLDELAPSYQARVQRLSPHRRKVVLFLCQRRHAVPVKEIARHLFMTHQTASAHLGSLRELGYVRAESFGRDSYYELAEPLMRLCLEMRQADGRRLPLFVEFLKLWFDLQQPREELPQPAPRTRSMLLDGGQGSCVLGRWAQAEAAFEEALETEGDDPVQVSRQTAALMADLLLHPVDASSWPEWVEGLVNLYGRHGLLAALGAGVAYTVHELSGVSRERRCAWVDGWRNEAGSHEELELPVRLLDVTARYLEDEEARALLPLAWEERQLLAAIRR